MRIPHCKLEDFLLCQIRGGSPSVFRSRPHLHFSASPFWCTGRPVTLPKLLYGTLFDCPRCVPPRDGHRNGSVGLCLPSKNAKLLITFQSVSDAGNIRRGTEPQFLHFLTMSSAGKGCAPDVMWPYRGGSHFSSGATSPPSSLQSIVLFPFSPGDPVDDFISTCPLWWTSRSLLGSLSPSRTSRPPCVKMH